jgi:hypothetical protein
MIRSLISLTQFITGTGRVLRTVKGFGNMLISSDRYVMNNGDGEIDCRLRSVIFERRGEYRFRFQCGDEPAFKSTMTLRDNELTVRETTN